MINGVNKMKSFILAIVFLGIGFACNASVGISCANTPCNRSFLSVSISPRSGIDAFSLSFECASPVGKETVFWEAARNNKIDWIKACIEECSAEDAGLINAIDPIDGMTTVMKALSLGHCELAIYLVNAGADLTITDIDGMTVLLYAVLDGSCEECIEPILQKLRNTGFIDHPGTDFYGMTALMLAAHRGYFRAVELLLRYGADKSKVSSDNKTALQYAVEAEVYNTEEQKKIIRMLAQ